MSGGGRGKYKFYLPFLDFLTISESVDFREKITPAHIKKHKIPYRRYVYAVEPRLSVNH